MKKQVHESSTKDAFCAIRFAIALREMPMETPNQNTGGGRMKQVVAGRKIAADSARGAASAAATSIGAVTIDPKLKPACAAEQIEQA
jgi:hypothetical protein